mmetsp:Transcript_9970/g.32022  ORF Transcript_9970/g.32022 Transcript_9970/m.32022 type:complete len:467 (-) Transcript_9970:910-2310(-)
MRSSGEYGPRRENGRRENGRRGAVALGGGVAAGSTMKAMQKAAWSRGRREESCSSDGTGCLLAGLRALSGGWCGSAPEPRREAEVSPRSLPSSTSRAVPGSSSRSARGVAPLKRTPDFHLASATPFEVGSRDDEERCESEQVAQRAEQEEPQQQREQPPTPRRRIMSPMKLAEAASSYDGKTPNGLAEAMRNGRVAPAPASPAAPATPRDRRSILKRHERDNDPYFLRKSHSQSSLDSDATDFEESEASALRAESQRRVVFALDRNAELEITALADMSWRTRRDCYWQPEEYAAMSQSRLWLERAVLQTGGRVRIEGESRRGLGLVCEPETRIARASKIQQTQRAVLRMHAEGASATRLARFAADASGWATRNALICAHKDAQAAAEADLPPAPAPVFEDIPPPAAHIPRCDSNTAETNGLAAMIRNDSLGNLHNNKDALAAYARARRRVPQFDAAGPSSVSAVSA